MKATKFLLVSATALLLQGCGTTWRHPSLSENDFYRDNAACKQDAANSNPDTSRPYNPYLTPEQQASQSMYNGGAQMGRAVAMTSYFNNCMMSKGYKKD